MLAYISPNLTLKDGKLEISAKKPFLLIEKRLKENPALKQRLEPNKMIDISTQKGDLTGVFKDLCWG